MHDACVKALIRRTLILRLVERFKICEVHAHTTNLLFGWKFRTP